MIKFLCTRYVQYAFILFLFGMKATNGYAQYGNVWAFGRNAGIDFNTNPPTPITTGIKTSEGCASICDSNGRLLFYTDGTSVWDRNNNIMPDGADLPGTRVNITESTTQGALIVPVPGTWDQYYIFSLGQDQSPFGGMLYYSIVDMTLNNGLGNVTIKGKLLDSSLTEHMTAVSGNNCNAWLLVISRSNVFKAYNIGINGIDPAVVSPRVAGGGTWNGNYGSIDVSSERNKLAIAQGNLVLYDFNVDLGTITNPLMLDRVATHYYYGVCFSPDNSKLYASSSALLQQFDLSLGDTNNIKASQTLIANVYFPALKRGPDGKIYCGNYQKSSLHVINYPNLAGTACQFVAEGFPLLSGTESELGLPNLATIVTNRKIYRSRTDTAFCVNQFSLTAIDTSGFNYVWEDGSVGQEHVINSSGTYWVSYEVNSPCMVDECVDTFKVIFDFTTQKKYTTTIDSGMCATDTIFMQASNFNGSDYIWEDGSTGTQRKTNQTGVYWVSYQIDSLCENHVDSFIITYPEKDYSVSFRTDTLVCYSELLSFQNTSHPHFDHFTWSFGDQDFSSLTNPQHTYTHPGSYRVMLAGRIGDICPDTAYQIIIVDTIFPVRFLTDRDSTCTGQSISFNTSKDSTLTNLIWQFGDGNELSGSDEANIQHAYDRSGMLVVTLSKQFRACPDTFFTDTVYVYAVPEVYLGADTNLCLSGSPIVLENQQKPLTEVYHTLWSTEDTTETLKVMHPGTYSLTISTEPLGCSTTESVTISNDCYIDIPNAFTPNGDGVNDYFFPRQLLSKSITGFKMQVFNRWGQQVFETTDINGLGWDGKFNGQIQPARVYVYLVEVIFENGTTERYQGNVTLMR